MDNNNMNQPQYGQQTQYGMQPQKKLDILGIISLGIACLSAILAILGTTLTCACSASKAYDVERLQSLGSDGRYALSAVFIISIFAIVLSLVAIVLAIIAIMKNKTGMMAKIALVVAGFAFIYAFLPLVTICSYNCSLNSYIKKS